MVIKRNVLRRATLSILTVAGVITLGATLAAASTTISTDISTGGLLTVTGAGTSTLTGIQGTYLNLTGTSATSTAANGFNLTAGCFSINGTCVGSGGSGSGTVNSGTTGQFPYYAGNGTTLTATSTFSVNTGGLLWVGNGASNAFPAINGTAGSTQFDHTFRTNVTNVNVATFQSMSNTGFSAIRFADETGAEHGAAGYGNSGASSPFGSVVYLESSAESGLPPQIKFIQSVIGSSNTVRQEITENGETWLAAAPTTNVGNVFGIRANSTSYATNATANSSLVRLEQLGSATALLAYTPNTFTNTDGAVRIDMAGASSNAPAFTIHQAGTGSWIRFDGGSNGILTISPNSGNPQISAAGNIILSPTSFAGIGTTTPTTQLQVTTSVSNATTTLTVGKTGQNKGSCLELYDSAGTAVYAYVAAGASTFTLSATSCK